MKKKLLFFVALSISVFAQAFPTFIRIPVLVQDSHTEKVLPSTALKALGLPESVVIGEHDSAVAVTKKLSEKLKGTSYELVFFGTIGRLLDSPNSKNNLCYQGNPLVAIDLIGGLADNILSDQLQLNFFRVAGERGFRNTRENNRMVLPNDEEYEWTREYLKRALTPGQIQTLTAYTDDGDDTNEDIIETCR